MQSCPLCSRALIDGPSVNEHHLVPRAWRGREKIRMHRICHNKIHAVFTERELAQYYHTFDRLLESEEIRKFVSWVRKKDPAYYDAHRPQRRL